MSPRGNAVATRQMLLEAAFWEFYRKGFHAASLDAILRETGVTKGALYHHFPSKAALGHAVVDEVTAPRVLGRWTRGLDDGVDPLASLRAALTEGVRDLPEQDVMLGCPLYNLALELSPVDEAFRVQIQRHFNRWRSRIAYALVRGQEAGSVRPDVDANRAAAFVLAALEGNLGLAKNAQSKQMLRSGMEPLTAYLEGLARAD